MPEVLPVEKERKNMKEEERETLLKRRESNIAGGEPSILLRLFLFYEIFSKTAWASVIWVFIRIRSGLTSRASPTS